nr:protein FAR1-related sequence 5 [Tanacetum cinerariifolium]
MEYLIVREITKAGFRMSSSLEDVVSNHAWNWLIAWVHQLGHKKSFPAGIVWEDLRHQGNDVPQKEITKAGFRMSSSLEDVVSNHAWNWLIAWVHQLGHKKSFPAGIVWEDLRHQGNDVPQKYVVVSLIVFHPMRFVDCSKEVGMRCTCLVIFGPNCRFDQPFSKERISSSERSSVSQNFVSCDVVDESFVLSGSALNALTEEIVAYEKESDETEAVKKLDALHTPKSFVTHSNFDTPDGTVYYISKVSANVLLVKGSLYDSIEDCIIAYMKSTAKAGFVFRRLCQKRLRNGVVKQKYLVCNRKGYPKGIHADEVFKYNYKEFYDVVWFDVTFKTNKYNMVFAPYTLIDNHRKKSPSRVVTDQDGAIRNTIQAEFASSKHMLCMWHITQKLPARESRYVYEMTKKKKESQYVDKGKDKDEEDDTINMFFKNDGLYKNIISATFGNKINTYGEKNVVIENFANEATLIVDHCVHFLSKYEPRLGAFVEKLKLLKKDVKADCPNPPSKNKTNNLEQLVGLPKPLLVDVSNPSVGTTKERQKLCIKEGKEKSIKKVLRVGIHFHCVTVLIITKGHTRGGLKFKKKLWLKKKCLKRKLFNKK